MLPILALLSTSLATTVSVGASGGRALATQESGADWAIQPRVSARVLPSVAVEGSMMLQRGRQERIEPRAELLFVPWAEGPLSITAGGGLGATTESGVGMTPLWLAGMGTQVALSPRISLRADLRHRALFGATGAWEGAAGVSLRL